MTWVHSLTSVLVQCTVCISWPWGRPWRVAPRRGSPSPPHPPPSHPPPAHTAKGNSCFLGRACFLYCTGQEHLKIQIYCRQKMELLFKGFGWYWSISRWRFQGILWDDMNRGYKLLYCKEYFKAFSSFFSDKTWGKCIMQHSHDMFTSMFTTTTFLVLSVLYSENLWLAGIISCILYK